MINRWTTCLRLLGRQEGTQLLPVLMGERWDPLHVLGSRWVGRHSGRLTCPAQDMEALGSRLMLASKVRPVQPPGLLLLRLAHRLQ